MASEQGSIFTSYPGKAVWTAIAIAFNAFRLPIWLVYFIPRFTRQNPAWSYRQAVRVRIVRAFLYNAAVVEMKTPLSLEPGKEKDRFVAIDPAPPSYYVGVAAKDPEIKPVKVGGTWYPRPGSEKIGYVVLHFHGGAYAIGNGREEDAGFAAATILKNTEATHVFCPQYRLSSNPGGRFPSQLQDAITSYVYLVERMGIDPKKIIVGGDSAGGHLTLGLVRYIAEHGAETGIKDPGLAWLWSPWVNPSDSVRLGVKAIERNPNFPTDYLCGEFGTWGAGRFAPDPKTGLTMDDPYIVFLGNPFATKVPIWVQTGQCEVLLHDDTTFAKEMQGIKGNKIGFQIEENSVHDIILTGKLMSFEKEAARAAGRANAFLKKHAA